MCLFVFQHQTAYKAKMKAENMHKMRRALNHYAEKEFNIATLKLKTFTINCIKSNSLPSFSQFNSLLFE